jgi:anti-sigma-K factor RskA
MIVSLPCMAAPKIDCSNISVCTKSIAKHHYQGDDISLWSIASLINASANFSASSDAKSPDAILAISLRRLEPSTTYVRTGTELDPLFKHRSTTMWRSAIAASDALWVIAIIWLPLSDLLPLSLDRLTRD